MAKAKSSAVNTEVTPVDRSISNDVPGTVKVLSQTSGGAIIVTDEVSLEKNLKNIANKQFSGKVFRYGEVLPGTDSTIEGGDLGISYRICSGGFDEKGNLHVVADMRKTGGDQDPIEVVYARTKDGGLNWDKKIIGRRYKGSGYEDSRSRVMDPTFLDAGNGKLFVLAGRWFKGGENWTKTETANGNSADFWEAALLIKSVDGGDNWTQHTIGKADCQTQEGTHITIQNFRSSCKGFLGGIDAGLHHSSGKLIFGIQCTDKGNVYSTLLISEDGGDNWRMAGGKTPDGNYECAIMELEDGRIVLHCRSDDVQDKAYKRAYVTSDFGENWGVYAPLDKKVGTENGTASGGYKCEGGLERAVTLSGKEICVAAYPQNDLDPDLGSTQDYGRNQITIYACNLTKSLVKPIAMLNYRSGTAPTSTNETSTSGTPFGGYSTLAYTNCLDGEYLVGIYEDDLGISIANLTSLLPRLEGFCNHIPTVKELPDILEPIARPIVGEVAGEEINYIGESTLGPVYVSNVAADFCKVDENGSIIDYRSGVSYPKSNSGTNKPTMGTGSEEGLIVYNSDGQSDNAEKVYTDIFNDSGVFGLSVPFTVAFEFRYSSNGPAANSGGTDWPAVFRTYSANLTDSDKQMFGCNVGKAGDGENRIVFNPFAVSTTGQSNTFRMMDGTGSKHGDVIHYAITIKEDGKQLHYVNGVEVNNTSAYSGTSGSASTNLPAPGVGFTPKNPLDTIKRVVIGNDAGGLVQYKIAFGNLKFYRKALTEEQIKKLYERRKEYLQALKTNYKSGFVGAVNELKADLTNVYSNFNLLGLGFNKDVNILPSSGIAMFDKGATVDISGNQWTSRDGSKSIAWTSHSGAPNITKEGDYLQIENVGNNTTLANFPKINLNPELSGASEFTIMFKFKLLDVSSLGEWPAIFSISINGQSGLDAAVIGFTRDDSGTNIALNWHFRRDFSTTGNGSGDYFMGNMVTQASVGEFHTLGMILTNERFKLYLDGKYITGSSYPVTNSIPSLGELRLGYANRFDKKTKLQFQDLFVAKRALTDEEMKLYVDRDSSFVLPCIENILSRLAVLEARP